MENTEAERRLRALAVDSHRFDRRSQNTIAERVARMLAILDLSGCPALAEEIRQERTSDGWPGPLRSWVWWDEKLYALAHALGCPPQVAQTTLVDRARLRGSV